MAQVNLFKFDTDGFPVETDPTADDVTFLSVTAGAGGLATSGGLDMNSTKITELAPGTAGTDAVNKNQLDSVAAGFDPKESCRLRSTADMSTWTPAGAGVGATLTAPTDSATHNDFDGVTAAIGQRILVMTAADAAGSADVENGIYTVTALGNGAGVSTELTRAVDFDEDAEVTAGAFTFVTEGTAHADTGWYVVTNDPITVDTTAIAFSQFAGVGTFTGGDGIDITGGVISVDLRTADSGLAFFTGELGVNLEASDPSLQIVSNELGVKFSATASALAKGAAGLGVVVDGVTIQINGSNQLEVIGTGSVDQYSMTAGTGGVTKGDPVFVSANDTVLPCDNANDNTRKYAGVASETVAATNPVNVQQEGVVTGVSVGGSPAAGDIVWLATPSGLTVTLPTGSGTHRLVVGKMKNATDVIIEPQYMAKLN